MDNNDQSMTRTRSQMNGNKNNKKRGGGHQIVKWVLGILLVVILVTVFLGYRFFDSAMKPLHPNSNQQIQIDIPIGTTPRQVGSILQEKKVVKNGSVFNYYAKKQSLANFQAGYYVLSPSMTLKQIADKLQKGGSATPIEVNGPKLLIREGENIDQIAKSMSKTNDRFTGKQFLSLMNDQTFIKQLAAKYPELLGSAMKAQNVRYRLEGYLFPAVYPIDKDSSLKDLVTQMVAKEDAVLKPYYSKLKEKNLTVQQALSVASLVEMEGSKASDRPKIAGVFLNRISKGDTLGSDVSTRYAVHKSATQALTESDLQSDNPYNTRVNTGYMPGPVDSPGESSIMAVINADREYMFFFAVTKKVDNKYNVGDVLYFKDINSFNAAVAKYNPEGK